MKDRWAINIDIEGFSKNYEYSEDRKTFAILALRELIDAIFRIGTFCYPGDPERNYSDRLFAHQFGDGFIICSDFPEQDASRAISIAIAIMRNIIMKGFATKAAISAGKMADIKRCYPEPICNSNDDWVHLGRGLMTIISVMGTALTKAHKLSGTQKGAVLILDEALMELGLPQGIRKSAESRNCIDWISSNSPQANDIAAKSGIVTGSAKVLLQKLRDYCKQDPVPPVPWQKGTFSNIRNSYA